MSSLSKVLAALGFMSGAIFSVFPVQAQDAGDPPDAVARIAEISGSVSYHQPGSQDWQPASMNYPVAPGAGVWTEPRSHAAVDIGGARIHLDGSSELEVTALNQGQMQLSVPQGAVYVHVYPGAQGTAIEIDTAHGAAHINQPGQYEIVAGDDQHPSSLAVIEGQAQLVGQSANLALQPGQRGNIAPDNSSTTDAAQADDFVHNVQAEEQVYQPQATQQAAQYVSPQETGYQDLARYGQFQQDPNYGAVWYPQQVAAGWAPYRYGHWAYVAPWGYTWVDDAPWGFTPFHYGRWVEIRDRWGWVPGVRVEQPVYAPALVSFFGDLGGVGINVSVGWVPLGPEEVYVPYYHHSPRYAREVNITNVRNETKIVNVVNNTTVINYNNYTNRRGATVVNREVMAGSRAVAPAYGRQPRAQEEQQWAHAKPMNQIPFKPQYDANERRAAGPKFTAATQHQQFNGHNNQPAVTGKTPYVQNGKPSGQNFSSQGKYAAQSKAAGQQPSQPQMKTMQKPKNAAPGPYIPPTNNAAVAAKPGWKTNGQQPNLPKVAAQPQAPKPTTHKSNNPTIMTGGNPAPKPSWQNGKPSNSHQQKMPAPNGTPPYIYPTGNGNPSSPPIGQQGWKQQEFKQQPVAKKVQPFTSNGTRYLQNGQHAAKQQFQQAVVRQNYVSPKNHPAAKPAQQPVPARQKPAQNCLPGAAACGK